MTDGLAGIASKPPSGRREPEPRGQVGAKGDDRERQICAARSIAHRAAGRDGRADKRVGVGGSAAIVAVVALAGGGAWFLVPRGVHDRGGDRGTRARGLRRRPGLDPRCVGLRRRAPPGHRVVEDHGQGRRSAIEEGQRVERDQIIARLDDTNARAAVAQARAQKAQSEANLTAARVAFENAMPTFQRNEQQFAQRGHQRTDVRHGESQLRRRADEPRRRDAGGRGGGRELALAERNLEDTVVRAPFAGIVTVKNAQEGEMVSPISAGGGFTRTGIGTIVDMDSLEIEVDVSENFINRVRPEPAGRREAERVSGLEHPGARHRDHPDGRSREGDRQGARRIRGRRRAHPAGDGRARVRSSIARPTDATPLRRKRTHAARLIVPPAAVQTNGDTGVVFVVNDDSVERRSVRLGSADRGGAGRVVRASRRARASRSAICRGSRTARRFESAD